MANHKSAIKRNRSNETKKVRNIYQAKTMRSALKKIRSLKDKKEAAALVNGMNSMLDKLAKKNVIHWKKAANLKSSIQRHIKTLQ